MRPPFVVLVVEAATSIVASASCRLSRRGRRALGAAGGDARRTAAETETAALQS